MADAPSFWQQHQQMLKDVGIYVEPAILLITLLVCLFPVIVALVLALSQREAPLPPPAGCRKLGIKGRSNLHDQYSRLYARGGTRTPGNPWTVKALFIYPLKSCAPVELEKSEVLRTGLKYDRQFTLGQYVTSLPTMEGKVHSEWQFMSMRKFPRLAKVETEIWVPDPSAPGYSKEGEWVQSDGCLLVRFPFSPDSDFSLDGLKNYGKILAAKLAGRAEPMLEFRVPFNPTKERMKSKGYKSQELRIWKDAPQALDVSPDIDRETLAKLKYTLGTSNPVTLFRIDPENPREVFKNAPKKTDVGFQTTIGMQDSVRTTPHPKPRRSETNIPSVPHAHTESRLSPRCSRQHPPQADSLRDPNADHQRPPLPRKHLHHRTARLPRGRLGPSTYLITTIIIVY
jgi:hypothetical protein